MELSLFIIHTHSNVQNHKCGRQTTRILFEIFMCFHFNKPTLTQIGFSGFYLTLRQLSVGRFVGIIYLVFKNNNINNKFKVFDIRNTFFMMHESV